MSIEEFVQRGQNMQRAVDELIQPNPEWGLPVRVEERRFYRLIEEREMHEDWAENVTLACGHVACYVVPLPPQQRYVPCMQCVEEYIEAVKRVESTRTMRRKDLESRP